MTYKLPSNIISITRGDHARYITTDMSKARDVDLNLSEQDLLNMMDNEIRRERKFKFYETVTIDKILFIVLTSIVFMCYILIGV